MPKKKTIKQKELPGLVKAISIIDMIYGIILLVIAGILFLGGTAFASFSMMKNLMPTYMIGGLIGFAIIIAALALAAFGIFYLYLAKAVKYLKKWAKIVQIILAVLMLFSIPIGTVLGAFILWVLLVNNDTKDLFVK